MPGSLAREALEQALRADKASRGDARRLLLRAATVRALVLDDAPSGLTRMLRGLLKANDPGPRPWTPTKRMTNLFTAPRPVEMKATGEKEARFLEDELIHRTRRGDRVRSKSEVIIADALHTEGVTYRYEAELVGSDGQRKLPDFTIEDAEAGVTYYWEHLGMLHDIVYRRRWAAKLAWYRKEGILPHTEGGGPNGTLVVTQDDERGGFDSSEVARLIQEVIRGGWRSTGAA